MSHGTGTVVEGGDSAGDHQTPVVVAMFLHILDKDRLVGEGVRRVAIEIVEMKHLVI